MEIKDLLAKLEAATEGSPELDLEVMKALGEAPESLTICQEADLVWFEDDNINLDREPFKLVPYLTSRYPIDAHWEMFEDTQIREMSYNDWADEWFLRLWDEQGLYTIHQSLPIAMVIAALKARM